MSNTQKRRPLIIDPVVMSELKRAEKHVSHAKVSLMVKEPHKGDQLGKARERIDKALEILNALIDGH